MKINLLSLVLFFFVNAGFSQKIEVKKGTPEINFLDFAQIFIDSSYQHDPKTYTQLSRLPFQKFVIADIKSSKQDFWVKITLRNCENIPVRKYFSFGFSNEYIKIYQFADGKLQQIDSTGTLIRLSDKSVAIARQELSTFVLDPFQENEFYIKIVNKSEFSQQLFSYSLTSFKLFNEESFKSSFVDVKLINFFFYGAFMVMFLYNLLACILLKSRKYAIYIGLLFFFFLYNASNDGLITEYFFTDYVYMGSYFKILIAPFMMVWYILFTRNYMQSSKYYPSVDKILVSIIGFLFATYFIFASGNWFIGINILLGIAVVSILLIFTLSIFRVRSVNNSGLMYLLTNALFLVLSLTYIMYFGNFIPHTPEFKPIEYLVQIMSIIQFSMFSLGLYNRVNKAELNLISQINANKLENEKLIMLKNNELEEKVNQRTKNITDQKLEISLINEQLEIKVKERTRKLKKAYRDLLNLNYELDTFIYRAAHDIRGPITTIMGLCNLAVLEKDFAKCHEYILILDKYSKSTQVTLNRILGVNDLKNDHVKLKYFSLNTLKDNVIALMIDNQDLSKMNIYFDIPVDGEIYSDIYLMEVILQNMIDNSIRFRKTKSDFMPHCKIVFVKEVDFLRIIISDNGEGVAESIKDKIFDMFYRGSEYASGSGLGLYITKIAVKKLNGTIELVQVKNDTIFEITLPYFKDKYKVNETNIDLYSKVV